MQLEKLKLRRGDRQVLESFVRSRTIEKRMSERASVILLASEGYSNRSIATTIGLHYNHVGKWRKRYLEYGIPGLNDGERRGRPETYNHDDVLLLVKLVTESPPDSSTRWSMRSLAKAMNDNGIPISASQCWRICKALDLKPWQVQSWMTSHDPNFLEKAADVCGLYLNPPDNAVVYSVDEKSGMQAKSRVNPTKPAIPGKPVLREFEYKRNGTATLFAGLDVHEGTVAGWVTDSTKSDNFVEFLGDLVKQTPFGLDLHIIADNLSAHKTKQVRDFLEKHPHVHMHHTPTHASWLNQVELFFSILERRLLRSGEFENVDQLADKIIAFINDYNKKACPFRWTYDGRPLKIA